RRAGIHDLDADMTGIERPRDGWSGKAQSLAGSEQNDFRVESTHEVEMVTLELIERRDRPILDDAVRTDDQTVLRALSVDGYVPGPATGEEMRAGIRGKMKFHEMDLDALRRRTGRPWIRSDARSIDQACENRNSEASAPAASAELPRTCG